MTLFILTFVLFNALVKLTIEGNGGDAACICSRAAGLVVNCGSLVSVEKTKAIVSYFFPKGILFSAIFPLLITISAS